ncbi:MAG: MBL fold metallo-hydrolase [Verrucomicrobiia bacterium]
MTDNTRHARGVTHHARGVIQFLGTSDGLPSADRFHASLLLRLAGQIILLDAGEPCSHMLKRFGVDFNAIDAVIITHTHSDHVGGLPMLIQSMWLEQRTRPLPLWMPQRAIRPLQEWLRTCYLFDEQLPFRIQWRPLTETATQRVGAVRFRAYRATHLDHTRSRFAKKYPRVGFDAFCLCLEGGGKRIAYSADLGSPQDLRPLCAQPLDVLVVELAHFHPDRLVDFLRPCDVRHVIVTHMSRMVRARLREVKARLRSLRPKKITYASDGDVIRF